MTSTPEPGRRVDAGSPLYRALHDEAAQIVPTDRWSEIESQIGGRHAHRWSRWAAPLTVAAAAGTIAVVVWTTTATQAGPNDVGPAHTGTSISGSAGVDPSVDGGGTAPASDPSGVPATVAPPEVESSTGTVWATPAPDNGKPPAPSASPAQIDGGAPTDQSVAPDAPDRAEASAAPMSTDSVGIAVPPGPTSTAEAEVDADAGAAGTGWGTSVSADEPYTTAAAEATDAPDEKAPRTIEYGGTAPQGRIDEAPSASAKPPTGQLSKPTGPTTTISPNPRKGSRAEGAVLIERYGTAKSKTCTNSSCQYLRVTVKGFGDRSVTCDWDESKSVYQRRGDGTIDTGWYFGIPGETVHVSCNAGDVTGAGRITW